MGDSRSFRDAFSRRNASARDGFGVARDNFREKAARPSMDAFAPKAKSVKTLPARGVSAPTKAGFTSPLNVGAATPGQPKLPKIASSKQPKMTLGKTAPFRPATAKPQKMTAPLSPKSALPSAQPKVARPKIPATGARSFAKDPFGRKDAKLQPPKALVPAAVVAPSASMTRPSAHPVVPPVSRWGRPSAAKPPIAEPSSPAAEKTTVNDLAGQASSTPAETSGVDEESKIDAARAPLQIVANESVLEHTGFKKFRRAARSSSLVLVSGAAADAIASTGTFDAIAPEADADDVSTTITSAEDPDKRVADTQREPSASSANPAPSSPAPAAESAATSPMASGPPPANTATPPEPPAPTLPADPVDPGPEVIAASTVAAATADVAAEPAEVVDATVEPPPSVSYDTASEPVDQLALGPKPTGAKAAGAVETSWQEVAGDQVAEGQPIAAVIRKMETSPVAGYWDGAAAGAKTALSRRGFNQDDIFGVVFGIAVLAFLLLWFVRGRGEETPAGDLLATPQSMTGQSLAAMPPPAPAPKVDPFGNAPVNLKPTGPIPEASPADPQIAVVAPPAATPTPAPVAPAKASPPAVVANPEAAIPVAERKMHAWFCTASSRMTKSSRTALTGQMATFEDVFAGKELVVRGYADTRGSIALNADLGSHRAQTVADYLKTKGLSVVDVQGVGELNGLDDNQNCPNQRRVDIWVKGGPAETPSRACAPDAEAEALICG